MEVLLRYQRFGVASIRNKLWTLIQKVGQLKEDQSFRRNNDKHIELFEGSIGLKVMLFSEESYWRRMENSLIILKI
jgi:hypothetical protein